MRHFSYSLLLLPFLWTLPACNPAPQPQQGQQQEQEQAEQEQPTTNQDNMSPIADNAVVEIDAFINDRNIDKTRAGWKTQLPKPTVEVTFDPGKTYYWNLSTNKGQIKVKLLPDVAPMHVISTIYLTRLGFYDDLLFHRVIPGFMAQGGCPQGKGTGSPGYNYDGEFSPEVRHDRPGLLSMANRGPGTDGSQFFLTFVKTPHLDGKHSIFGEVASGMETMRSMEKLGHPSGRPKSEMKIEQATITVE